MEDPDEASVVHMMNGSKYHSISRVCKWISLPERVTFGLWRVFIRCDSIVEYAGGPRGFTDRLNTAWRIGNPAVRQDSL